MTVLTNTDQEILTQREALIGGPHLDGYAYRADVYCCSCGRHRIAETVPVQGIPWPDAEDTEQAPRPIYFGESEDGQYCADCGVYLFGGDHNEGGNMNVREILDQATECVYCGYTIPGGETVPSVDDDAAWAKLAAQHSAGCEWVITRAHRRQAEEVEG